MDDVVTVSERAAMLAPPNLPPQQCLMAYESKTKLDLDVGDPVLFQYFIGHGKVLIRESDVKCIERGEWLQTHHLDAFCCRLDPVATKTGWQSPNIDGKFLNPWVATGAQSFRMQIINIDSHRKIGGSVTSGGNHWVVLVYAAVGQGSIRCYDSLLVGKTTERYLRTFTFQELGIDTRHVIEFPPIPQQKNNDGTFVSYSPTPRARDSSLLITNLSLFSGELWCCGGQGIFRVVPK
jgi:hypothetical protein